MFQHNECLIWVCCIMSYNSHNFTPTLTCQEQATFVQIVISDQNIIFFLLFQFRNSIERVHRVSPPPSVQVGVGRAQRGTKGATGVTDMTHPRLHTPQWEVLVVRSTRTANSFLSSASTVPTQKTRETLSQVGCSVRALEKNILIY